MGYRFGLDICIHWVGWIKAFPFMERICFIEIPSEELQTLNFKPET
jgi:hypothetical protein